MTQPKVALITGVTGQDGAYLAELLLDKGYEVHGIKRRASLFNTDRIDHLYQDPHVEHQRFTLHYGDLTDSTNLIRIIQQVQPDEIYNLAAHEPRGGELRDARVHGQCRRHRHAAHPGGHPHPRPGEEDALLPGQHQRALRPGAGDAADGDHALLPAQPLRGGQALRLLDHGQLPRGLRPVRLQRHPVQPREPAARRDLRHAQDHARDGAHRARPAGLPVPGQPERAARLGPRDGLCRDAVADAAAGRSPRTSSSPPACSTACASSSSWRRANWASRWRFSGEGDARDRRRSRTVEGDKAQVQARRRDRARRPALLPPHRGRDAARRPEQGQGQARLGTDHQLRELVSELVGEMVAADYDAARRDSLVKQAGFQAYDYHE